MNRSRQTLLCLAVSLVVTCAAAAQEKGLASKYEGDKGIKNDPVTQSNGEQALWIDGKPWKKDGQIISHLGKGFPKGKWIWDSFIPDANAKPFEGFQWRNTNQLNLNFLWLLVYITKAPPGHISKVWFDDIVVARKYIGPITPLKNQ